MLISSHRHRLQDLSAWMREAKSDPVVSTLSRHRRRVITTVRLIRKYVAEHPDSYVSISWGKDSTVLAHLAHVAVPRVRLAWLPAGEAENPDCILVRDEFLRRFDVRYEEHPADNVKRTPWGHDGAQADFVRVAHRIFGDAPYICGIRAEESAPRRWRCRNGLVQARSLAPLGWWRSEDVFAYLHEFDLPIHPAYACNLGGAISRERIRVGTIGGVGGTMFGRREWERTYYPEMASAWAPA